MTTDRRDLILAGPNGAGKTTFATEFLPNEANCPIFVNADLIAAGLSPFRADLVGFQAGRLITHSTAYLQHDATRSELRDAAGANQPLKRALTFPSVP